MTIEINIIRGPGEEQVRNAIRALAERGNVTWVEYSELRINSYERDILYPALDDAAFANVVRHGLLNCSRRPKHGTYDDALIETWAPELLKRFDALLQRFHVSPSANPMAPTIPCDPPVAASASESEEEYISDLERAVVERDEKIADLEKQIADLRKAQS